MKRATSPQPPAQPCGGRGKGGARATALKFCLKKRELHLNYHQKHTENDIFNENLLNKKVFKDVFARHF
jgi:hypothetical protein